MPELLPKPKHLGPEYASQFADPAIVAAYHHRPPYAPAVFPPWFDEVQTLIERYSTNRAYQSYNLIAELEQRGLFEQHGVHLSEAVSFEQSVESYIESIHSRNGFSRDRITHQAATDFDAEVRGLLVERCPDGTVQFNLVARIVFGRPR